MRESKKNNTARRDPPVIDDERFKNALADPIFRRVPKKEKRVDIDNRFKSMFHDKKFKLKYNVDKRGRPIDLSTNEDLRQYYNLVEDDDEKQAVTKKIASVPTITRQPADGASGTESESDSKDEDNEIEGNVLESDIKKRDKSIKLSKTMKKKLHDTTLDFARGDGILAEDSSDDSESSEGELIDGEDTVHEWGELDKDAERTEEATNRLALCNADWDRLKAVDLMVLFHSFLPPGGALKSINIYTSEYGKERLAYEDVHGPTELKKGSDSESEVSEDEDQPKTLLNNTGEDEEGDAYHMEKLRKYQLNRLKYFYAVLEFDSVATAEKVYGECDGIEYESSATRLDLRFIPDNMTFEDSPADSCDSLPLAEKYRPRFFTTTALQQAKVTLTWDETDPLRRELIQKVHNPKEKIDDEDLRAYLASSDSEAESDNDGGNDGREPGTGNTIDKYRALLESIETKEKKEVKDVEMEITWGVGLKEKTESLVKKKLEEQAAATLTPWEEILAKKKEKRKLKKTQPKFQTKVSGNDDDEDTSEQEEGLSDDDVDVDMNDPFFRDEIASNEIMKASAQRKRNKEAKVKTPALNNDDKNAALELLLMDDTDNKKHFNFKRIVENEAESKAKKKRRNRKAKKAGIDDKKLVEESFEVDVADNRFSALFSSHHYNVDPSDPSFKKTKGMEAIMQEKYKRRSALADTEVTEKKTTEAEDPPNPKIRKGELTYLVKSVKRNTEMLQRKRSKRK